MKKGIVLSRLPKLQPSCQCLIHASLFVLLFFIKKNPQVASLLTHHSLYAQTRIFHWHFFLRMCEYSPNFLQICRHPPPPLIFNAQKYTSNFFQKEKLLFTTRLIYIILQFGNLIIFQECRNIINIIQTFLGKSGIYGECPQISFSKGILRTRL